MPIINKSTGQSLGSEFNHDAAKLHEFMAVLLPDKVITLAETVSNLSKNTI